ncbi:MAG TPA: biotin transporter BioY [Acetobacteraceae bacterium]|jgi:biotin transport system substrate-specific component|nr:biotin transporter BioY [Acetobacteraceae bacterium]
MKTPEGSHPAALRSLPLARPLLRFAGIVLGSAVLALSAKIEVPFWPVPMTLEVLAVLGLAGFFGARLAGAAVLLWLVEGAAGLPVFAGVAAGPAYFLGPTGGYLAGFLAAALLVGLASDRGLRARPFVLFASMLGGVAVIYLCGAAWLAHLIGWERSFRLGVVPFVPADLTKAALAAALVTAGRRLGLQRG